MRSSGGPMSGFRNPVIPGFHPDPSVCRVGDAYFLATSSFTYFPGVPIFSSTDLVHWTQLGNALDRPSQLDLSATAASASQGVFAPTIRHHGGRFWMITTVSSAKGLDTFFVTAADAAGPWSDPIRVDVPGIDPDLAWDDEGRCWVHFSVGRRILRCRIDDATGQVLEAPAKTWSGTGLQFPEAPHLIRRGSTWYLLIAEGGTERGHAVSIARGPSPVGPWEGCPANPILSHRSTARPIQNTGHADLVEAGDGSWWMVLLGIRPRGMTPGFHVLGRETFLVPVAWVDGWPVVSRLELEMSTSPPGDRGFEPPPARDDFDAASLAPPWISVRRPLGASASLAERPGWLTLHGAGEDLDGAEPVFVARRQQHRRCRVRALVDPGTSAEAGLAVRMDEHAHYDVFVRRGEVAVRARIGPTAALLGSARFHAGPVVLRIETRDGVLGPDRVALGYETGDGAFEVLSELDGRYVSTEVAGGFIGRVIGMYAVDGAAAFDWFDYEATGD
jgi:xylan 1,4-beta-xylosidase